jgi:hypothetical protein
MGSEIESRQGIGWWLFRQKKSFTIHSLISVKNLQLNFKDLLVAVPSYQDYFLILIASGSARLRREIFESLPTSIFLQLLAAQCW